MEGGEEAVGVLAAAGKGSAAQGSVGGKRGAGSRPDQRHHVFAEARTVGTRNGER